MDQEKAVQVPGITLSHLSESNGRPTVYETAGCIRYHSGIWRLGDIRARAVVAALLVALSALLSACDTPTGDPIPAEFAAAVELAWTEAGLPDATGALDDARILWATRTQYRTYCVGLNPDTTAACTTQGTVQSGLRVDAFPLIVIAPGIKIDHRFEQILHETIHVLIGKLMHRKAPDVMDAFHKMRGSWAWDVDGNAQQRARELVLSMDVEEMVGADRFSAAQQKRSGHDEWAPCLHTMTETVRAVSGEGL